MTILALLALAGCKYERYPEDDRNWKPHDLESGLIAGGADQFKTGDEPQNYKWNDQDYSYSYFYNARDVELQNDYMRIIEADFWDSYDLDVREEIRYDSNGDTYIAYDYERDWDSHMRIDFETDGEVCSVLIERSAALYTPSVDWRFTHREKKYWIGDDYDCWDVLHAEDAIEGINEILTE